MFRPRVTAVAADDRKTLLYPMTDDGGGSASDIENDASGGRQSVPYGFLNGRVAARRKTAECGCVHCTRMKRES